MDNNKFYFSRLEQLVKYKALDIQDTIDISRKVNDYITTLPIDKRREAIGKDLVTWFFEVFSAEDSVWNETVASEYTSSYVEMLYLAAKPTKTLMSNPAFNYAIAKLMNSSTDLTLVNNYHVDYLEHCLADENVSWNYEVKTMQDVESEDLGQFDFIFISTFDICHDVSLVKNFCNALNSGGTMVISHTNDDLRVYSPEIEYTSAYEMHESIKSLSGLSVYHIPTAPGHTVVIKD
jgi:arginine/ornithine N-succinyltransferase beta subunit